MRLNTFGRRLLLRLIYMQDCYVDHSHFQLYTPKPHLEIYRNTCVFSGSSVWNSLSSYIHNSNSVHLLKPSIYVGYIPNDQ